MFTKIINTIRDTINRTSNSNNGRTATTTTINGKQVEQPCTVDNDPDSRRRCSITEELENNSTVDNHSIASSRFSTATSSSPPPPPHSLLPPIRNNSISGPIPIISNNSNNQLNDHRRRRRSSTLFGISNIAYDDYMQKDLISNSWS
ncbi:MAG: hypothetical protein EXX96DRAFT_587045 [Benjaminiella poitrasii]|nr:MAG: hypothetical protein EXX96DRAFT_587045 [Benjaminiella poitrasii]